MNELWLILATNVYIFFPSRLLVNFIKIIVYIDVLIKLVKVRKVRYAGENGGKHGMHLWTNTKSWDLQNVTISHLRPERFLAITEVRQGSFCDC